MSIDRGPAATGAKTILVLGAAGSLGGEMVRTMLRHGWRVRAFGRGPSAPTTLPAAVEWVQGDAMNAADVLRAATGADAIFHGVHPGGYHNWSGLCAPMLENTIAAAAAVGARIAFPGTIYNYGPDAFPRLRADSQQRPRTRKGKIRVAMERQLETAQARGVRSVIVRAGDFIGPGKSSWFPGAIVQPGKPVRRLTWPGRTDLRHAWAYLPDLAETFARLLERDADLPPFARFHFAGHFLTGDAFLAATRRAADAPKAKAGRIPWAGVWALAPFNETMREMLEMQYLWKVEIALDNGALVDFLGEEPHTPLDAALRATLREMGCMTEQAPSQAARPARASVAAE